MRTQQGLAHKRLLDGNELESCQVIEYHLSPVSSSEKASHTCMCVCVCVRERERETRKGLINMKCLKQLPVASDHRGYHVLLPISFTTEMGKRGSGEEKT